MIIKISGVKIPPIKRSVIFSVIKNGVFLENHYINFTGVIMIDITINGTQYKMILNENLFKCVNVLFMGFIFYEDKRYKKYISANNTCYLIRG